jgi:hypothetical protein
MNKNNNKNNNNKVFERSYFQHHNFLSKTREEILLIGMASAL